MRMPRLGPRCALVVGLAVMLAGLLTTAGLAIRGGSALPHARAALGQTTEQPEAEDEGIHGGPTPRFHDSGACPLPAGVELAGNWTHGDYVSAWAEADETKVRDAAHSPCGKPTHVAERRTGRPDSPGKSAGRSQAPGKS
jgi:hypothetical protein